MDKSIITDTDIDLILEDWYERDADTFVKIRKSGRLGWEKTLDEDAAYSSYLLEAPTREDLIKRAYPLAKDMIAVMNPPMKVTVRITPHDISATDGKVVYVSTKVFDDMELSHGEKLDVFLGYAIHEGCHLLYTDFTRKSENSLVQFFTNILEDERIEEILGEEKPGLANFLEKTKYYVFDNLFLGRSVAERPDNDLQAFCDIFLRIIRFPKYLNDEDIKKFGKFLLAIKKVVNPLPTSTAECQSMARQIVEIIKDLYKESERKKSADRISEMKDKLSTLKIEVKSHSKGSDSDESDDSSEEGDETLLTLSIGDKKSKESKESDDTDTSDTDGVPVSYEDTEEEAAGDSEDSESGRATHTESTGEGAEEEADVDTTEGTGDKSEEKTREESTESTEEKSDEETEKMKEEIIRLEEEIEKAEKETDRDLEEKAEDKMAADLRSSTVEDMVREFAPKTSLTDKDASSSVRKDRGLLGEVCEGKVELGEGREVYFTKGERKADSYKASYERIRKYIPAVSRIMKGHCKEYKLIHKSMRSGVLDINKLVEAIQGVPTVYIREGEVHTDRISVCILVDESGSMSSYNRDRAARDTAILLREALQRVPNVTLFIYGHTGDIRTGCSTDLIIYQDKTYSEPKALGDIKARNQNRDGNAIYEVARRVRKQTKDPVLMFILSDGEPAASCYTGRMAISHTRENVLKVEKMGFSVVQVCISTAYDPALMFKHYIKLTDMDTLAVELSKVVKKAVLSLAKVHVS